ncbi:MAG: hypothetical protein M0Z61_00640 [Nitrospiraceae bacterium]|nr:hypothetical protein [Nitrospiraceae bacterium]
MKTVALADAIRKTLTVHLTQAKAYAEKAIACIDDRGSCNFDHVCLTLSNYPPQAMEEICEKIGLQCSKKGNHLYPEFHISGEYGVNMKNTIFCEKFVEYLSQLEYEVRVIYILD